MRLSLLVISFAMLNVINSASGMSLVVISKVTYKIKNEVGRFKSLSVINGAW